MEVNNEQIVALTGKVLKDDETFKSEGGFFPEQEKFMKKMIVEKIKTFFVNSHDDYKNIRDIKFLLFVHLGLLFLTVILCFFNEKETDFEMLLAAGVSFFASVMIANDVLWREEYYTDM